MLKWKIMKIQSANKFTNMARLIGLPGKELVKYPGRQYPLIQNYNEFSFQCSGGLA